MEAISNILLTSGAVAAAFYCYVLGRRLKRFSDLEKGMGGAIALLSVQVDDLTRTLVSAQKAAAGSAGTLQATTKRAEEAARRLDLLLASLHDLPDVPAPQPTAARHPYFVRHRDAEGAAP